MTLEKCPHCGALAAFAEGHCPRCCLHRRTGERRPAGEIQGTLDRQVAVERRERGYLADASDEISRRRRAGAWCVSLGALGLVVALTDRGGLGIGASLGYFMGGLMIRQRMAVKPVAWLLLVLAVCVAMYSAIPFVKEMSHSSWDWRTVGVAFLFSPLVAACFVMQNLIHCRIAWLCLGMIVYDDRKNAAVLETLECAG